MFKNQYFKSALGIYISYSMLGMILIILSTNMPSLTKQFGTDAAGISFLISMEGLVRSATLYISGRSSDKVGRKIFLCIAPVLAAVFLVGIPLSPTYQLALLFSAFAGVSHAFMDAASYPSLIECFPKTPGTATVIIKLFVATGQAILPLVIAFFLTRNMFYGYTFYLVAAIAVLNGFLILSSKFPKSNVTANVNKDQLVNEKKFAEEPVLRKEGIALIIIGFTSNAIFMTFQTWMPTYGQQVLGMAQVSAIKLISYYSMGAIVSVIILAKLLQKTIKPVLVLLAYPIIALTTLLLILTTRNITISTIGFAILGLSSAGVLQMAQTTMGELFWKNKGATIALVSTASGVAAAVMPALTGLIVRHLGVLYVFYFLIIILAIGILCAAIAKIRYDKIVIVNPETIIEKKVV